ncbi:hypothetical protein Tco_0409536 [Tanacetum coccineum]
MESLNSNSQEREKERELHPLQQMQDKAKESCMVSFRLLHSHLTALSNNNLKGTSIEGRFERAFATFFEQDVQTFTRTMFLNLDQLVKHLSKEEFQELESSSAFRVHLQQFQTFLYSRFSFDNEEAHSPPSHLIFGAASGEIPATCRHPSSPTTAPLPPPHVTIIIATSTPPSSRRHPHRHSHPYNDAAPSPSPSPQAIVAQPTYIITSPPPSRHQHHRHYVTHHHLSATSPLQPLHHHTTPPQ